MLVNLFLGKADGETEAKEKDFLKLFYKNDTYYTLMDEKDIFIISGQKGTGKTVLAKYIEDTFNKEPNSICKMLNRNDIVLEQLIEAKELSKDELQIFHTWFLLREYAMLILNKKVDFSNEAGGIIAKLRKYFRHKMNLRNLKNFLNERYPQGNYECSTLSIGAIDSVKSSISGGTGNNVLQSGLEARSEIKEDKSLTKKEYYKVLGELKKLVCECLKVTNVIIILDDIDETDYKLEESEQFRINLLGLINAANELNDSLYEEGVENSKCIILIRKDILDVLNNYSSNLNKIIVDRSVNLNWIRKENLEPHEHPLMDMILNKIQVTNNEYKNMSKKEIYQELFPNVIDGKDLVSYLIDNSFGRPRDVINYLNIVKKNNKKAEKFKAPMFVKARSQYSNEFRNELLNEMHIHYDKECTAQLLLLLTDYGKTTFGYEGIKQFFDMYSYKYPKVESAEKAIEILYKFGVIGNSKKTSNGKYKYFWSYRPDGRTTPDFNMRFSVHYAMRKSLGL